MTRRTWVVGASIISAVVATVGALAITGVGCRRDVPEQNPPSLSSKAFTITEKDHQAAIEGYLSTGPRYILITIIDTGTGKRRVVCIEPEHLLSAIHIEKRLSKDEAGWKRAKEHALGQKDRIFSFSSPAALKKVSPRYSERTLAEVRTRLGRMTTADIIRDISDQDSTLYKFCLENGRPTMYTYLDAVAHVLMEKGVPCGRSCKPGLLDIYKQKDK